MRRRRRRVPVSDLRASLGERIRSREEPAGTDWENDFQVQRPSLLRLLFGRMHRHLKLKISLAVAVVFVGALLQYTAFPPARPVMEGLRYVTEKNIDLRPAAEKYIPAFKLAWQDHKLPELKPGPPRGSKGFLPLEGELIGKYGMRVAPGNGREERHYGIELAAPAGTAVRAVLAGRVEVIVSEGETAALLLEHDAGWQTFYRGLKGVIASPGDRVEEGQAVGTLGLSGEQVPPSLYFELRYRGRPVEPPAGWVEQFEKN